MYNLQLFSRDSIVDGDLYYLSDTLLRQVMNSHCIIQCKSAVGGKDYTGNLQRECYDGIDNGI